MRCGRCGIPVDAGDSFCRRCGAPLNRRGLPTVVSRSLLPVPWALAKSHVVQGVAALAVGTAVELLRREVARHAAPRPQEALALPAGGKPPPARRGRFPWSRVPKGEYEVTETVIQRRVRFLKW